MKKNIIKMRAYGFTLVELLATIVVIAVVSLITVPAVTAIIERTRKASFAKSAMNVNKISDNYYISNSAIFSKFNDITFDCNNVLCSSQSSPNIKNLNLGAEGAMGNGYVKIYKGGSVEFLLTNGKYCAEKNPNKEEVKIYNGNCEGIIIDNEKIRINSIKTTSTTKSIKVYGNVTAGKSGVGKYEFYIDGKLDGTIETTDINYDYTFKNVTGKEHKIKVVVYNGTYDKPNFDDSMGMDEKEIDASLLDFGNITISPSTTSWATSKTYTISGTTEGNIDEELQYQVKYNGETYNEQNDKDKWHTISSPTTISIDTMSTKDNPTTIYVRLTDGVNIKSGIPYTETKIDTTNPELTLENVTLTTKSISVPITASDAESGIKSIACKYGTSTSYGSTGTVSNNKCVINNIKNNTNYYYRVTTTNNAGLSTTKTGNSTTGITTVTFKKISQVPTNTSYAQSKTVKVNYVATNVTNPTYYVKTTVATTSTINGYNCGTSTNPGTCGTTATKSYVANTWYKVTESPDITLKENGTIRARINDGIIYSTSSDYVETKIDPTAPINVTLTKGTVTTNSITVVASATDNESGISGYEFSIDNGTTWKAKQTSNTYTFSGLKSGTYNIKVRAHNNSGLSTISGVLSVPTATLTKPVINIPSGWATSKSVTITYPSVATIKQYSLDGGSTWKNYTGAITFTTNGSIVAKASDGINEVTNAGNITQIDTTNPTVSYSLASGTYNENKTITITANDDNFSYMHINIFKDGTSYKEYNGLTNKTQTISLDSDGTWIVYTNVFDKAGNKQNQDPNSNGVYYQIYYITTKPIASLKVLNGLNIDNGWVGDENNITLQLECTSGVKRYDYWVYDSLTNQLITSSSIDSNATIQKNLFTDNLSKIKYSYTTLDPYGKLVQITTNVKGNLIFDLVCTNGEGVVSEKARRTVKVDSAPSLVLKNTDKSTSSLTVQAIATSLSGISKYEFNIDSDYFSWKDNGTNDIYTFTGLNDKTTYTINSYVTNNVGLYTMNSIELTTGPNAICNTVGDCSCSDGTLVGSIGIVCKNVKGEVIYSETVSHCGGSCGPGTSGGGGSSSGSSSDAIQCGGNSWNCLNDIVNHRTPNIEDLNGDGRKDASDVSICLQNKTC